MAKFIVQEQFEDGEMQAWRDLVDTCPNAEPIKSTAQAERLIRIAGLSGRLRIVAVKKEYDVTTETKTVVRMQPVATDGETDGSV